MKVRFDGNSGRMITVETESRSVRVTVIQDQTATGLLLDDSTAFAFAAAITQAARQVAKP